MGRMFENMYHCKSSSWRKSVFRQILPSLLYWFVFSWHWQITYLRTAIYISCTANNRGNHALYPHRKQEKYTLYRTRQNDGRVTVIVPGYGALLLQYLDFYIHAAGFPQKRSPVRARQVLQLYLWHWLWAMSLCSMSVCWELVPL